MRAIIGRSIVPWPRTAWPAKGCIDLQIVNFYKRLLLLVVIGSTKGAGTLSLMACTRFCSMDPVAIFCKSSNRTMSSRDTDISGTHCRTCSPNMSTRITNFRILQTLLRSKSLVAGTVGSWGSRSQFLKARLKSS